MDNNAHFKVGQNNWKILSTSETMSYLFFFFLPPSLPPLFDSAHLFSIYSQHDFQKVHFKWLGLFEKVSEVVLLAKGIVL